MNTEKEKLRQILYKLMVMLNFANWWWLIEQEYQNRITEAQAHEIIMLIKGF